MEPKRYDAFTAAQEQLTFGLAAFRVGAWAASISLCGAAEECLPWVDQKTMFDAYREEAAKLNLDLAAPSELDPNRIKNWLKHPGSNKQTILVNEDDASFMIWRAITRLQAAFPSHPHGDEINAFAVAMASGNL